jgi:hypothetical protein
VTTCRLAVLAACGAAAAACGVRKASPPDGAGGAGGAGDGGVPSARATLTSVAMIEALVPPGEQIRVELEVENTGPSPIANVGIVNARVTSGGLDLGVQLAHDPPGAVTAVAAGETRAFAFAGAGALLSLCSSAVRVQASPHHGLAALSLTVVTSVGGTVFANQDIALTCADLPPPPPPPDDGGGPVGTPCREPLDDACAVPDVPGMFNIHCSRTWDAVQTDTYYCAMPPVVEQAFDCGDYRMRLVSNGGQAWYSYYYDATSGDLVAVLFDEPPAATICAAGPRAGFSLRMCVIQLPLDRCGSGADGTDGGRRG